MVLLQLLISLFKKKDAQEEEDAHEEEDEPRNETNVEAGNSAADEELYQRQGRLCCISMCDMRIAVIFINVLFPIILSCSLLGVTSARIESARDDVMADQQDNQDLMIQEQEDALDDLWRNTVILVVVGVTAALLAIVGALRFNKYLLLINAVYVPVAFALTVVTNYDTADQVSAYDYGFEIFIGPLIGAIISPFTHTMLVREIHAGIMTKENYANEKHCCCVRVGGVL